jgi:hypothetical protein
MGYFGHPIKWNSKYRLYGVFYNLTRVHALTMILANNIKTEVVWGNGSQIRRLAKKVPSFG